MFVALLLCACSTTPDRETAPEPEGFWTGPMGGPVPATIEGGSVIDTTELAALISERDPVLVDVGPAPHKPDNIAVEAWVPPPHRTLPGSTWLPGAGAGALSPPQDDWYRGWLQRLTGGDQAKTLVIFCHPDCWGSWNAARRDFQPPSVSASGGVSDSPCSAASRAASQLAVGPEPASTSLPA